MLHIIKNYKKLFLAGIRSEFAETIVTDWYEGDSKNSQYEDSNWTKVDDLLAAALKDRKINWLDSWYLEDLASEYSNEKNEQFKETKEKTRSLVENMYNELLDNWYSFNNAEDIKSFESILKILGIKLDKEVKLTVWWSIYKSWENIYITWITDKTNWHTSIIWKINKSWEFTNDIWSLESLMNLDVEFNNNKVEWLDWKLADLHLQANEDNKEMEKINKKKEELIKSLEELNQKVTKLVEKDTNNLSEEELNKLKNDLKELSTSENLSEENKKWIENKISDIDNKIKEIKEQELEQKRLEKKQDEEHKRINLITSIVDKNANLSIEDWKVYLTHKTPDWKTHKWFFTIDINPDIKDKSSLESWVKWMEDKLDKKYPKIEEKVVEKEPIVINNDINQPKESLEAPIEITYQLESDEVIKNAIASLEHNWWINQEQIIGTYTYRWKTENIVLQSWRDSKYSVELKWTWFFDDIDLDSKDNVEISNEWPTIEALLSWEISNIKDSVKILIEKYKKQEQTESDKLEQDKKSSYPKTIEIDQKNIDGEKIKLKLIKQESKIVSGVPVWEDKFILEMDNDWFTWNSFSVDINTKNWENPSEEQIEKAKKELLEKYQEKFDEYTKEKETKAKEQAKEDFKEKVEEVIEKTKFDALKDLATDKIKKDFPNEWKKWISEFSKENIKEWVNLSVEDINIEENEITIQFNDEWLNEKFNEVKIKWALDSNWNFSIENFKKLLAGWVETAIKQMIKQEKYEEERDKKIRDSILNPKSRH